MMGAKMRAEGAMGVMERSVWSEGGVLGTGKLSGRIMDNALRMLMGDVPIELFVDGTGPTELLLQPSTAAIVAQGWFANLGIRDNVLGMIANAIRSHSISGCTGTLKIEIWL